MTIAKGKLNGNDDCGGLGIDNDNDNDKLCKEETIEENNDEWGDESDHDEFEDDGDWGSAEEIDVFDENGMKKEISLNVRHPLATARTTHFIKRREDSVLSKVPNWKKLDVAYGCQQHGREYLCQIKFHEYAIQGYEYFCNDPGCNVAHVIAVQTHELGSNMSIE